MSLFYGLAAGLFVSMSTWAAMTYVSQLAGICLGFFLLTFFVVSAVYLTGDDLIERQKMLLKALTNTEVVFFERLRDIDYKVNSLVAPSRASRSAGSEAEHAQTLDTLLTSLDGILTVANTAPVSPEEAAGGETVSRQ
jgi:hypothetical protein